MLAGSRLLSLAGAPPEPVDYAADDQPDWAENANPDKHVR